MFWPHDNCEAFDAPEFRSHDIDEVFHRGISNNIGLGQAKQHGACWGVFGVRASDSGSQSIGTLSGIRNKNRVYDAETG